MGSKRNPWRVDDSVHKLGLREGDSPQSKSTCDLRKSLAWDSAFFSSPGVLDPEELFDSLDFSIVDGVELVGYMETEGKPRIGESSARKSLAWDSAFFTSAGVLNAEELSIINKGFKKSEVHLLAGVEEDMWRCTESEATGNTDSHSLASLENDLFDDIRASVKKSNQSSSNGASSTQRLRSGKGMQKGHTSDDSTPVRYHQLMLSQLKGTACRHSKRPPKISSTHAKPPQAVSQKRASLYSDHAKMETRVASLTSNKNNKKKKIVPKDAYLPVKSSSALRPRKNKFVQSGCASSDFTDKSPLVTPKKTFRSNLTPFSTLRTPLNNSIRHKKGLVASSDSTFLWSSPNLGSSYTPPANSDGQWPLGSSMPSIYQGSDTSFSNTGTAARRGILLDSNALQASAFDNDRYHQSCLENAFREGNFSHLQTGEIFVGTNPLPTGVSEIFKPSCLRNPSPKIGYFDVEQSAVSGGSKFQSDSLQRTFKTRGVGNKISGAESKTRHEKQQSAGIRTGTLKMTSRMEESNPISRQKQHLRESEDFRKRGTGKNMCKADEDNKENTRVENEVDDLTRRIEATIFTF
ncbi:hypothetical protein K2173_020574 [Erythroxylum novogranatense]|uniref:Uncharacterized protein n=1 Tax=Erythroxylum novogranatense TaxID=1862640 RepID=A0AAV8TIJ3_9ROSI|nr:hypothetical protein K2173_020574 [Erythroxylum novogranatense]